MKPWLFEDEEFIDPKGAWGFVYEIIDLTNNKRYIGKKQFVFKKTKTVKGKKKRTLVESDWQTYWSSSEELREKVSQFGEENFKRTILRLCYSKAECSYYELKYQMEYDVLLNQDLWYNKWISCKLHANTLKNIDIFVN